MGEQSPESRGYLAEKLNSERITKAADEELKKHIREVSRDEIRKNLEVEQANITALEEQLAAFRRRYDEMSEDEFYKSYDKLDSEIYKIIGRVTAYADKALRKELNAIDFVEIDTIDSLKEFLEAFPMQFIPKKQEIGRILALAKQMHEARAARGEISASEPLTIIDIGGANGALGKLITDLAKENGLDILYTVVDPYKPAIQAASEYYRGDPSLRFVEQTGEAFNKEIHADSAEITKLIQEREKLINDGEATRSELRRVIQSIYNEDEEKLDAEKIRGYMEILKKDFGINLPENLADSPEAFLKAFKDDFRRGKLYRSFVDTHTASLQASVDALTTQIEILLNKEPAKYDLVINSWMPVSTDFTKEVRGANGAAIFYAIDRSGATGCRSDATNPVRPGKLGQGESYHPGTNYESQVGWVSHSTRQVQEMLLVDKLDVLWKKPSSTWTPWHFSNAFITQTKKGYVEGRIDLNPEHAGIQVRGEYPWERELTKKGGEISPMLKLKDRDGKLDCYAFADYLADELEKLEQTRHQVKAA